MVSISTCVVGATLAAIAVFDVRAFIFEMDRVRMLALVIFALIVSLAAVCQLNILLMYLNAAMYYIRRREMMTTMAISSDVIVTDGVGKDE